MRRGWLHSDSSTSCWNCSDEKDHETLMNPRERQLSTISAGLDLSMGWCHTQTNSTNMLFWLNGTHIHGGHSPWGPYGEVKAPGGGGHGATQDPWSVPSLKPDGVCQRLSEETVWTSSSAAVQICNMSWKITTVSENWKGTNMLRSQSQCAGARISVGVTGPDRPALLLGLSQVQPKAVIGQTVEFISPVVSNSGP